MLIAEEKVKIVPCLTSIPDVLTTDTIAWGNLQLIHTQSGKQLYNQISDCCQFIWSNFWRFVKRQINGKEVAISRLSDAYHGGILYKYNECNLKMTIDLKRFINPFKDKYSDLDYIEKYLELLQEMGSPWALESISNDKIVVQMFYKDIEEDERAWLTFHWQAVRNLILPHTLHVPARFIELVDLYRKDFDLLFLYQAANRMVPFDCLAKQKGLYTISNYSPFYTYETKVTLDGKAIPNLRVSNINRSLTVKNLRNRLKKNEECKKLFSVRTKYYDEIEHNTIYKLLTMPQSKEDLYLKLRLLKSNKL